MKAIKMLMMAALTILSVAVFAQNSNKEKSKMKMEQTSNTCPMHPDATSNKAGKCPKCGMELKEKAAGTYACPMKCEGEKTYDKAGKCPKCGMNLKEIPAATFACPMKCEGDKTYDKQGKCPKCGMNLKEKAEKKEDHTGHNH